MSEKEIPLSDGDSSSSDEESVEDFDCQVNIFITKRKAELELARQRELAQQAQQQVFEEIAEVAEFEEIAERRSPSPYNPPSPEYIPPNPQAPLLPLSPNLSPAYAPASPEYAPAFSPLSAYGDNADNEGNDQSEENEEETGNFSFVSNFSYRHKVKELK